MNLHVSDTYEDMSQAAADALLQIIAATPRARILVATGNTPMEMYRRLAASHADFSSITAIQLDEYAGLEPDDRRSLYGWMDRSFVAPLGLTPEQVLRFDVAGDDPKAAVEVLDAALERGGPIDVAILGLGPNGHLGFNEPPCPPDAPTRLLTLTPESIASNAAYWGTEDDVPRQAVTVGMDRILTARHIFLLVSGAHKREILARVVDGPMTDDVPASHLQRSPGAIIFADRDAVG